MTAAASYRIQSHPAEPNCCCNVVEVTMTGNRERRYRRYPTSECALHGEGFPPGTLVHHRGAIHSVGQEPEHPDGGLRGGWGKVIRAVKQHDFTFEYEVAIDRSVAGEKLDHGGVTYSGTWWASYHINRVRMAED